ncbi:MAG: universal stress protein [Candidatus Magnetoovum sp. WYHC-5]|nr:universal stress protein [Candidatus Magnetoovum sp. WYHC-5]
MKKIKKVLVVVEDSNDVLREGIAIARDERCYVTVLKVLPEYDGNINLVGIRNIEDVLSSNSQKEFNNINEVADRENYFVKTRIEYGKIYEKILETIDEEKCDLVVLGVKKTKKFMGWFDNLLKGNPLDKIVSNAQCPVLFVRV